MTFDFWGVTKADLVVMIFNLVVLQRQTSLTQYPEKGCNNAFVVCLMARVVPIDCWHNVWIICTVWHGCHAWYVQPMIHHTKQITSSWYWYLQVADIDTEARRTKHIYDIWIPAIQYCCGSFFSAILYKMISIVGWESSFVLLLG